MIDAVDTIKILGSLLGNGALSKGSGGGVLGNILGAALGGASGQKTQGGDALGDVLGGLLGGGQTKDGGLADMLGSVLGGANKGNGGGVDDLLGSVLGGATGGKSAGGMGDLLGGLLGASTNNKMPANQPDLGGLLGGLLGGGSNNNTGLGGIGGLGGLLGAAVTKYAQAQNLTASNPNNDHCDHLPHGVDQAQATDQATLIIRAMINAAKSDGSIDNQEQDKIIAKLGDISQAEANFIRSEFAAPLDVNEFVSTIPNGMEQQLYAVSLMAIDLDTNQEASYLNQLAQGLRIEPTLVNNIHEQLGVRKIYA